MALGSAFVAQPVPFLSCLSLSLTVTSARFKRDIAVFGENLPGSPNPVSALLHPSGLLFVFGHKLLEIRCLRALPQ